MTRLLEFLIALGLVLALFVIVGLALPSERRLSESVETNRKMTIVYDTLNNVRRLKDWNQLLPGKSAGVTYSGGGANHEGVGARIDFDTHEFGKGHWEITDSERPANAGSAGQISYSIVDKSFGKQKTTTYKLEPTGKNNRNVKITQIYDVKYPWWNLVGRYAGMYVSRQVGDAMKISLSKLTNLLATVPNADYREQGSTLTGLKVVDVPAEDLLVVKAGNIDLNNDAIKGSIKSNQEWIKRVMEANGLVAAGPVRIITTDMGTDKYAFDVAQPVKKAGVEPGTLTATISGGAPVEVVNTKARRAASASYTGYMSGLNAARDALRAWATTYGYEVTDRPYESWNSGTDAPFASLDSKYDLYWAIK